MSTYEQDLREALKAEFESGHLREMGDSMLVFGPLSRAYPARGSKIDWEKVSGSTERGEKEQSLQIERFVEFFDEICSKFALSGPVLYAGDSATDFAIEGSLDTVRRVLHQLLAVPQHHYFTNPECSWCMCLTTEGDMAFGMSSLSRPT